MSGTFEVYEAMSGNWRFRLKASTGRVVAVGEAFPSKVAAVKGCEQVQVAALGAVIADGHEDGAAS